MLITVTRKWNIWTCVLLNLYWLLLVVAAQSFLCCFYEQTIIYTLGPSSYINCHIINRFPTVSDTNYSRAMTPVLVL
jgi:hypothetical protein